VSLNGPPEVCQSLNKIGYNAAVNGSLGWKLQLKTIYKWVRVVQLTPGMFVSLVLLTGTPAKDDNL
jgi:hypothetical protein